MKTKRTKHTPKAMYPPKPFIVRDVWDWKTALADSETRLETLQGHLASCDKYIANETLFDDQRQQFIDVRPALMDAIRGEYETIEICNRQITLTLDYEVALNTLHKAFSEKIMTSLPEDDVTHHILAEGGLHRDMIKKSIWTLGFVVVVIEGEEHGLEFFMRVPEDKEYQSLIAYIESRYERIKA